MDPQERIALNRTVSLSTQEISKTWKIILGIIIFLTTVIFLVKLGSITLSSENLTRIIYADLKFIPIVVIFMGIIAKVLVIAFSLYYRKKNFQEQESIPTSKKWRLVFIAVGLLNFMSIGIIGFSIWKYLQFLNYDGVQAGSGYWILILVFILVYGGSAFIANVITLLLYFHNHKPRRLFQIIGRIVLTVSYILLILSILG